MDKYTAELNKAVAKSIGARTIADGTVKLRVRCVAYPESSKHYADIVVVSAASITLSLDGAADATVGATGVIDITAAAYNTLGEVCDAINLSANWEAEIVAGLRSDAVNGSELLARSTSTFRMFAEVSLYADSSDSGVYKVGYLLEPGRAFEHVKGREVGSTAKQHRVGLVRHRSLVNTNGGEATTITAYELKPDKASAYKTLGVWLGADNAEKDSGATDIPAFHADYGNSILIEVTSTGWVDAAAYLDIQGVRE